MFNTTLIIIGIVLVILFLIFVLLCSYALCRISSIEDRQEEELNIIFSKKTKDKNDNNS